MSKINRDVVKVTVATHEETYHVDYSRTDGYVGPMTVTITTITGLDADGKAVASERHQRTHPKTTENYTLKMRDRVWRAGRAWLGLTREQYDAREDAKMDAAYATAEGRRAYEDARCARIESDSRRELMSEAKRGCADVVRDGVRIA